MEGLLNESVGEKQESRVMMVSHWLSCRGSQFLIGEGRFCWGL